MEARNTAFFAISLLALLLIPPVHADVLTLQTDELVYDRGDKITFSGTEEEGKQMVTLIIRDPSGTKVELKGDPSSDIDGHYEIVPIAVRGVFSALGVYEAIAFTASQPVKNGTSAYLDYDGKNVRVVEVYDLELDHIRNKAVDEGKELRFRATISDPAIDVEEYSLGANSPAGAVIDPETGRFSWTPTEAQGPGSYLVDIVVRAGISEDVQTITITVNEADDPVVASQPEPAQPGNAESNAQKPSPEPAQPDGEDLGLAAFVDIEKDPRHYVDRYLGEQAYREWFDDNFPEYGSIHEAVGLPAPKGLAAFVDAEEDPRHYVDRYLGEQAYREWFDYNFPEYGSIHEAVGLPEPPVGICGEGTALVSGVCTITEEYRQSLVSQQPKAQACFLSWCW